MGKEPETYFDKYLDQRLRNMESKIEEVLESNRELRSSNRQVFWVIIALVTAVVLGFSGLVCTVLYVVFSFIITSASVIQ